MHRTIAIVGIAFASFGFTAPVFAQAGANGLSPAQQLGVQERSLQTDSKVSRKVPSLASTQAGTTPAGEGGLVLYRIDRNTRVLVGPARGTSPTADFPAQAQQGDNRLQLLHDLEQ